MSQYVVTADRVCKVRRKHRASGCGHDVLRGWRIARIDGKWYCAVRDHPGGDRPRGCAARCRAFARPACTQWHPGTAGRWCRRAFHP